jgi:uncharacterized cysteine cluster protein YcgN (CxxCxxCC family)
MTRPAFPCNGCGKCCRNVHLAKQTEYLDRGDGTCRHFCDTTKGCRIYEARPAICRVDLQYELHYAQRYSWDEFVAQNIQICRILPAE